MPQPIARPVFQVSIVAIMLFQVAALVARSKLELSLIEHATSEAVANDLSYLVLPPILLALMFPYLARCKRQLAGLLRLSALTWRLVVLSILLGLILRVLRWSVLMLLIRVGVTANEGLKYIVGPIIGFDCPPPPVLMLSLGVTALLVPVIEETINRGFIMHALLPRGLALSIGLSALLFALMHPPGTYVSAFLIGVLLSVLTLRHGVLWPAVITHASYNAAAVLDSECFKLIWNPSMTDPQLTTLTLIAAPIALLGGCLAIFIVMRGAAGAHGAPRRI